MNETDADDPTRCIEVDQEVKINGIDFMIRDFGGQHHYHHMWHLLIDCRRSFFVIMANPMEEGFESQVMYCLRTLTMKPFPSPPTALIIFSHLDQAQSEKKEETIQKRLNQLFEEWKSLFQSTIQLSNWMWMDCRYSTTPEMTKFCNLLAETATSMKEKVQTLQLRSNEDKKSLNIILRTLNDSSLSVIYKDKQLTEKIKEILNCEEGYANYLLRILEEKGEFISFSTSANTKKEDKLICVNMQRFGRDILSYLIDPTHLIDKLSYSKEELKGMRNEK